MCLAIPSKIIDIDSGIATTDVEGVQRKASLMLVEDAKVGDYVIVHAGFAIQILDEAAALESLNFMRDHFFFRKPPGQLITADNGNRIRRLHFLQWHMMVGRENLKE